MSMQLTIVGCSGSYPGPDSPASCYLVQAEHEGRTWNILMDLGNGALGALHRYVDPLDIDAVFLSHLHADHCIDMTSYYVLRKYHPSGEQEPLPVWGPRRTARRLARAYDLPKKPGMREEFVFHRLRPEEDPVEVGPFSVTPYAVDHPVERGDQAQGGGERQRGLRLVEAVEAGAVEAVGEHREERLAMAHLVEGRLVGTPRARRVVGQALLEVGVPAVHGLGAQEEAPAPGAQPAPQPQRTGQG